MNRRVFLGTAGLGLIGMARPSLAADSEQEPKPNFVFVIADDVSWSSFGCNKSGYFTKTPNIDRLATQGIQMSNFFCGIALCTPLRHELITGLLPPSSRTGAGNKNKQFTNLCDHLAPMGYAMGYTGKSGPKGYHGFTRVDGFNGGCNDSNPVWSMDGMKEFVSKAVDDKKPFCVFFGSVHAHHPWTIGKASNFPKEKMNPPTYMVDGPVTRKCLSKHAAEVEELDKQVGAAMDMLDEMKLTENTILIFLSEHGMAMPNGKWSLYDFGCRALCLARWPGKIKAGATTDKVAMYCDILPTVVDIAGGKVPTDIDGHSLKDLLLGDPSTHKRSHALMFGDGCLLQRAIRTREYKLIWTPFPEKRYYEKHIMRERGKMFHQAWLEWVKKAETDPDAKVKVDHVVRHPEFELYDVTKDPFEVNNLANDPQHSGTVQELFEELKKSLGELKDGTLKFAEKE